jgi:hypothetical protein
MRRGEGRWHQFAPPDRRRPVLLLTRDSVSDVLTDVTVAPITSRVRDIDSEVLLTEADGMREVVRPRLSAREPGRHLRYRLPLSCRRGGGRRDPQLGDGPLLRWPPRADARRR